MTPSAAVAGSGSLRPDLAPPVAYQFPTEPNASGTPTALLADLNGDGHPDLITADSTNSDITIRLGTGTGTFGPTSTVSLPAGVEILRLLSGRFTSSGHMDVVVETVSDGLYLLPGNGDGTFGTAVQDAAAPTGGAIAAADMNGDGHLDLVDANVDYNSGYATVEVLLGDGTGAFPAQHTLTTTLYTNYQYPSAMAVGDFNGDGKLDVALSPTGAGIVTFAGDGTGGLSSSPTTLSDSSGAGIGKVLALAAGDVNGDGNTDLVALLNGNLEVFTQAAGGLGTGAAYAEPVTSGSSDSLALADFTGDGHLDAAVANGSVWILPGTGAGSFDLPRRFQPTARVSAVYAGDLNGDGRADVLDINGTSDGTPPSADVLLANAPIVSPAPNVSATGVSNLASGTATLSTSVDPFGESAATHFDLGPSSGYGCSLPAGSSDTANTPSALADGLKPNATYHVRAVATTAFNTTDGADSTFTTPAAAFSFARVGCAPAQTVTGSLNSVTTGYLDGSGHPDVIETGTDSADVWRVLVTPTDGSGRLGAPSAFDVGDPLIGSAPHAADFTGDGNVDVAFLGDTGSTYTLTVLPGDGSGGLGSAVRTTLPDTPAGDIATGDFNGDGLTDVVYVNDAGVVELMLAQRGGTFASPVAVTTDANAASVAGPVVGDFNGDGKLDIAIAEETGTNRTPEILVLNGDGTGGLGSPIAYPIADTSSWPVGLLTGDLNGDGKPDLVVIDGTYTGGQMVYSTEASLNTGGGFGATQYTGFVNGDWPDAIADLDGDGKADLLLATPTGMEADLGVGDGTFNAGKAATLSGGQGTGGAGIATVADLNGDHSLDIVAAGETAGTTEVLLNSSTPVSADTTPPTITITAPADGAHYQLGSSVPSAFSCSDSGLGVASCTGDAAAGAPFDTNDVGTRTFTVSSTDGAGNSSQKQVSYTVDSPQPTDNSTVSADPTASAPDAWQSAGSITTDPGSFRLVGDAASDFGVLYTSTSTPVAAASYRERAIDSTWGPPQSTPSTSSAPELADNRAGELVEAWATAANTVDVAVHPAGSAWSAPETLPTTNATASLLAVAIDGAGEVTALVKDGYATETISGDPTQGATGQWNPPHVLATEDPSSPNGAQGPFAMAEDDNGDIVVAWGTAVQTRDLGLDGWCVTYCSASGPTEVDAATRAANGTWSATRSLSVADAWTGTPAVAVSASGQATVAFSQGVFTDPPYADTSHPRMYVASGPLTGPWDATQLVGADACSEGTPGLAANPKGDTALVWTCNGSVTTVESSYRPAGGTWGPQHAIADASGTPSIGIDDNGNATVSWIDATSQSCGQTLSFATHIARGWTAPANVATGLCQPSAMQLRVAPNGPATVAWETTDPTSGTTTLSTSTSHADLPVAITGGPSGLVNHTDATFSFDSGVTGTKYQCQLDNAGWKSCTSPQPYSALGDGSHRFQVRSYDTVTATGGTASARNWTIDTTPPQTLITSGPSGQITAASASFSFSANEAGSSFACSLDGSIPSPCVSPQQYSGLTDGSHSFSVTATDRAGNADPTAATRSFSISTASGVSCPVNLSAHRSGQLTSHASGACGSTSYGAADCPTGQYNDRGFGAFVFIAVSPAGCFRPRNGEYVSHGPMKLNGLRITIPSGTELVLDYTRHTFWTTSYAWVQISDGWPKWQTNAFRFQNHAVWTSYKPKFYDDLPFGTGVLQFGGLKLVLPQVEFDSDNAGFGAGTGGALRMKIGLQVPPLFGQVAEPAGHGDGEPVDGGPGFEGQIETSNGNGLQYLGELKVPTLKFGAFEVEDLTAGFDTTRQVLDLSGTTVLPGGAEVALKVGLGLAKATAANMYDPPVRIRDFELAASDLNKPIFSSGFFLQDLHVALGYNTNMSPLGLRVSNYTLGGGGGGTFGPEIPKSSRLYQIFHTQSFISLNGDVTFGFPTPTQPWYMIASGSGHLLNMQLANAAVQIDGTDAINIWGSLTLGLDGYGLNVEVPRGDGWYDHGHVMQLHGYGNIGLPGLLDLRGEMLANELGVEVCRTTDWQGNPLPIGERTGYHLSWGATLSRVEGSCDLGPLTRARPHASTASVGEQFTIARGTRLTEFAVTGRGAAPKVKLSGPSGESVSTPAGSSGVDNQHFTLFQDPSTDTTHVIVRAPAPGLWTIAPLAGSAPITSYGSAHGLPTPRVSGHLSCHARCVLHYRLTTITGQRVALSEVGAGATRQIGSITHRTGVVRFTPRPGTGGVRQIVATVIQDGYARAQVTIARFRVRSARPARPRHLTAHARRLAHGRLRVSATWRRVAGASSYIVTVTRPGWQTQLFTHRPAVALTLPGRGGAIRIAVRAVNTFGLGAQAARIARAAPVHHRHRRH